MKKHVQAGWNERRKVSHVMCDKRVAARMKGKEKSKRDRGKYKKKSWM